MSIYPSKHALSYSLGSVQMQLANQKWISIRNQMKVLHWLNRTINQISIAEVVFSFEIMPFILSKKYFSHISALVDFVLTSSLLSRV